MDFARCIDVTRHGVSLLTDLRHSTKIDPIDFSIADAGVYGGRW